MGADAAPRRLARRERRHDERHHEQDRDVEQAGEALHDGGDGVAAELLDEEPVGEGVELHDLALADLLEEVEENERGRERHQQADVPARETGHGARELRGALCEVAQDDFLTPGLRDL